MRIRKRSELEWKRLLWWQRWQGWRNELICKMAAARKAARNKKKWQGRSQSLLDMWKNRAHCSMVSECG